jgi:hypothetical protein
MISITSRQKNNARLAAGPLLGLFIVVVTIGSGYVAILLNTIALEIFNPLPYPLDEGSEQLLRRETYDDYFGYGVMLGALVSVATTWRLRRRLITVDG